MRRHGLEDLPTLPRTSVHMKFTYIINHDDDDDDDDDDDEQQAFHHISPGVVAW